MIVGFLTKKVSEVGRTTGPCLFYSNVYVEPAGVRCALHYLHVVAILFVATVALMLLMAKWKPMTTPYTLQNQAVVDLKPWRSRHWFFCYCLSLWLVLLSCSQKQGYAQ